MALDEDGFLPAAFRKVQKIGKRLKKKKQNQQYTAVAGFL